MICSTARNAAIAVVLAAGLAACGQRASSGTYGETPDLVAPNPQAIPTTKTPKEVGWPAGAMPTVAEGFVVTQFAGKLSHPRWLYVLPNGDVLAAQTGDNSIMLLRDADHDGVAELRTPFLTRLSQPFGMGLLVNSFFVATSDAVLRFPYTDGQTKIDAVGEKVMALPGGGGHSTRNLLIKFDGTKMYLAVGSASNIGEAGAQAETNRAAILEANPNGSGQRVFASGLRNPVGMAWNPVTGALWTSVNERDALGDDLVPDYMTSVKDGGFYGWPYSYYGQNVDKRVQPQKPDLVAKAIAPDYALGAHTASLGLAFYNATLFPPHYKDGAFIGQHGSWNRSKFAGYKVIFVPFKAGKPSGPPEDFLTGFLTEGGEARGRPVGIVTDRGGALYVADDVGNAVWRVTPKP
jgi:glucose/arabinose dehydrogenase